MKNESKPKQKPKQKHIFIKVDKQIEPGDLVRCVRDGGECKSGDIRKVSRLGKNREWFFYTCGSDFPRSNDYWEVVHKLKVGDLVELHKNGKPMKVTAVNPESGSFSTPGMMLDWYATDEFRLYQKPKTESIEDYDGIYVGTLNSTIVPDRKAEMQKAVAEMIVGLLDKKTEVKLGAYSNIGRTTVDDDFPRRILGLAKLHPNDTWDTLTGLYVALSKATGRDLPDWIYGREDSDGIS